MDHADFVLCIQGGSRQRLPSRYGNGCRGGGWVCRERQMAVAEHAQNQWISRSGGMA